LQRFQLSDLETGRKISCFNVEKTMNPAFSHFLDLVSSISETLERYSQRTSVSSRINLSGSSWKARLLHGSRTEKHSESESGRSTSFGQSIATVGDGDSVYLRRRS